MTPLTPTSSKVSAEKKSLREIVAEVIPEADVPSEGTLRLIRNLYCKECNDDEFARYMYYCSKYKLDPMEGYVECVKYSLKSPAMIFLGKRALLTVASRNKNYDGCQTGIFYRNPNRIVTQNTPGEPNKEPTYSIYVVEDGKKKRPELYAYCIVYRKDKKIPTYVEIKASEYHRGTEVWNTKLETMAKKVALSQALEQAFPEEFAAAYVAEEFGLASDEDGHVILDPELDTNQLPEAIAAAIASSPVLPNGMDVQPRTFIDNDALEETAKSDIEEVITNAATDSAIDAVKNVLAKSEEVEEVIPQKKQLDF